MLRFSSSVHLMLMDPESLCSRDMLFIKGFKENLMDSSMKSLEISQGEHKSNKYCQMLQNVFL